MPRQPRIDAPGALQHIIARGNEKQNIFEDKLDRQQFLARLGDILSNTQTMWHGILLQTIFIFCCEPDPFR